MLSCSPRWRAYRTTMRELAAQSNLAVWYAHQAVQPGLPGLRRIRSKQTRRAIRKSFDKAYSRDHLGTLKNLTETVNGHLRFVSNPPLVVPSRELDLPAAAADELQTWMTQLLSEYAESSVARPTPPGPAVHVRRHRPQGGRCRQRRAPAPGSCCSAAPMTSTR